jgi:hypothetical protein
VLWVALPGLLAAFAGRRWSEDAVLIAGMLLCTTIWAALGEDWKPYNRHVVPALPFLALLAVYAVRLVVARPAPRMLMASYFVAVCLWILLEARAVYDFTETWANPLTHRDEPLQGPLARTPDSDRIGDNRQAAVGKFLRLNYPEHITIVYDQMGQTPWYAGLDKSFIDTLGLTTREVGVSLFDARNRQGVLGLYRSISQTILSAAWPEERRSLGNEGILDYVFGRSPHLFLFHEELLSLPNSVPSRLFRDPRLRERYRPRFRLEESVRVFERKGFGAVSPWKAPEGCTVAEVPSS